MFSNIVNKIADALNSTHDTDGLRSFLAVEYGYDRRVLAHLNSDQIRCMAATPSS